MDREAWRAIVHGVARVDHNLMTKPPPNIAFNIKYRNKCTSIKIQKNVYFFSSFHLERICAYSRIK